MVSTKNRTLSEFGSSGGGARKSGSLGRSNNSSCGFDSQNFTDLLHSGNIDEASTILSRVLDSSNFNHVGLILPVLKDFLKGESFDESIEILSLIANLNCGHQSKLVELMIDRAEEAEDSESKVVNDVSFIQRMQITSFEVFHILAKRILKLRRQFSGKSSTELSEVRRLFSSFIFPGILQSPFNPNIPYCQWLHLALLTLYLESYSGNSSTTATKFVKCHTPNVTLWSLVEQTFNLVDDSSHLSSNSTIYRNIFTSLSQSEGRNPISILDLWMMTRTNLKMWSKERTVHYIQNFILHFSYYYQVCFKRSSPSLSCLNVPSSILSDSKDLTSRSQSQSVEFHRNLKKLGVQNEDYSYLLEDMHISAAAISCLNSESARCLIECVIFIKDMTDFVKESVYEFESVLLDAVKALVDLNADMKFSAALSVFLQFMNVCGLSCVNHYSLAASQYSNVEKITSLSSKYHSAIIQNERYTIIAEHLNCYKLEFTSIATFDLSYLPIEGFTCLCNNNSNDHFAFVSTSIAHFLSHQVLSFCSSLTYSNSKPAPLSSKPDLCIGFLIALTQFRWPSFSLLLKSLLQRLENTVQTVSVTMNSELIDCFFVPSVVRDLLNFLRTNSVQLQIEQSNPPSTNPDIVQFECLSAVQSREKLTNVLAKNSNNTSEVNTKNLISSILFTFHILNNF